MKQAGSLVSIGALVSPIVKAHMSHLHVCLANMFRIQTWCDLVFSTARYTDISFMTR